MQVKNTTSTMNKNLNYSFLIRTFKESFLEYTLNTWAGFYSKIVDLTANMLIIDAENYINNEYMRENIDFLCSIAYCKELFSYILQQASLPEEIDFARKENVNLLFKFPSYLHDKSGANRSQYRPAEQQPTSASLVVAKNTNLEQLCPQVNLPQTINLARSTEVNSSFKLLQSLHDEENSDLTQFTHIDNQPTITNAEPTQVKQVNVNQQELNEFLRLVAEGEQDAAELISTQNSDLLLVSGDVTDLSGRKFNNITGFQYAVWALDSHMWNMMLRSKNFPRDAIKQQLEGMATGSWVAEHGVSASWQNLIDALGLYINLCHNISSWKEATNQWNKVVGSAQRLLPAHVINEYCHATRSFAPCPNFENAEAIPRSRKTSGGDWFTCSYLSGVLGEDFAICRAGDKATPCRVMSAGALEIAIIDQIACRNMLATKIKLREEIFDEFIGVLDMCYGKSILGI
jgi:hypothetical protein